MPGTGDVAGRKTDTVSVLMVLVFQREEGTAQLVYPVFYEGTFVVLFCSRVFAVVNMGRFCAQVLALLQGSRFLFFILNVLG